MSEDEFTRLFKYMTERFDKIDKALEEKASNADMQRVLGLLDELAKRQEISDDERLVMGHQLERLDRWTHELAKKIGYELTT
jgi:hypothetical protein